MNYSFTGPALRPSRWKKAMQSLLTAFLGSTSM